MAFTRIQTPDKNLQLIQDNIDRALSPLQAAPLIDGNMLTGQALLAAADNKVAHKLGYTPSFFVLTQQNANSVVWQIAADSSFITLKCSADCTVSLWVK